MINANTHIVRISLFTDGANNVEYTQAGVIEKIETLCKGEKRLKMTKFVFGMIDSEETRKVADTIGARHKYLNVKNVSQIASEYLDTNWSFEKISSAWVSKDKQKTPVQDSIPKMPDVPTHEPGKEEETPKGKSNNKKKTTPVKS